MNINNNVTIIDVEGVRKISSQYKVIKNEYHKIRDEVIKEIKKFLKVNSNTAFTARELSEKFGLSSETIASCLCDECRTSTRTIVYKYARVLEDGTINFNDICERKYEVNEYYYDNACRNYW